jgi:hypothetical protein
MRWEENSSLTCCSYLMAMAWKRKMAVNKLMNYSFKLNSLPFIIKIK